MASKQNNDTGQLREEWPRIRVAMIKGATYYSVDGRPEFKRKAFPTLKAAREQATKWANSRARHGTSSRYLAERDASRFVEALDVLAPHNTANIHPAIIIVDAAKHYAAYLEAEKIRASSKPTADALAEWVISYDAKDRDERTRMEIRSVSGIYSRALGQHKLSERTRHSRRIGACL